MADDTVLLRCSESMLTCQICMERFESPRILPCQHTFCRACVLSLIKKHCIDDSNNIVKSDFPCPNCRKNCRIRAKTTEEDILLKAFPENLLLKDLLEAEEVASETPTRSGGKKIAFGVATVEKVRDTLCRYQHIIVAIQSLLRNWPPKEPRFCHPMQYCTDIRAKLSSFMVNLTEMPDLDEFPKVGNGGRTIRTILSGITEEERWIKNTYTLDAMLAKAREVGETPCCLDYIPIISPLMSAMRHEREHGYSRHRPGPETRRHDVHGESTDRPDPRGGNEWGMPPRDYAERAENPIDTENRVRNFLKMLVVLCVTVLAGFIASALFPG